MNLTEKLKTVLNNIPSGLCIYQMKNGRIYPVFHNPAFYTILGYSDEHILQTQREMTFLGVHEEDLPVLKEKVDEMLRNGTTLYHTCRVFNDKCGEYRWIRIESSIERQEDGSQLLYAVYSDASGQKQLEKEMSDANEKMQDLINAIPGGVAIYKVSDIFETVYFSEGVPELSGYTVGEYKELIKRDAAEMTYWEDTDMVVAKAKEAIRTHQVSEFEFRKQHRNGHIVWVRVQMKWIGEEDGLPLLHCVFHNISDLKEAQLEMDHLVNSIPGGIASYRIEGDRLKAVFLSDGVIDLSGYNREEYEALIRDDAMDLVYEPDRKRVLAAVKVVAEGGNDMDVSCRIREKGGRLVWIHMNGRRMGPLTENPRLSVVFTGMTAETRLYQSIANETADGIYVIDKENYDLLYVNESKGLFAKEKDCVGQKCYMALHGKSSPCSFCTLKSHCPDGKEHAMLVEGTNRFYTTHFRESDWNGIKAYVKYVRDVTEEVNTRRDKERLEQYFQTMVKNLPGGVAVVRYEEDGGMAPEFISDGFAAMTRMTLEDARQLYRLDARAGVHPDDIEEVNRQIASYIESGRNHCEIVYRLKTGDGGYIWVKNTLSLIQNEGGERRVYAVYHDITREREEQEQIRRQYKDLLLQHYRTSDPNTLILGHCNITQGKIQDIIDYTHSDLLRKFGNERDRFFTGISGFITDSNERQRFLDIYLSKPALEAFGQGVSEQRMECFVQIPGESKGRYVRFKMNMVITPDSGDVTGILSVTDVTERTISNRILHQLSVTGYDFVVDVDLIQDSYAILSCNENTWHAPPRQGRHSSWIDHMQQDIIVPKDREQYKKGLDPNKMYRRLKEEGPYTFAFSIIGPNGDIRTKNMTVSAVDLRLGRVCLVRTDITDSVQEQQGLLNMMAYTFERMAYINISSGRFTMYTRETVLEKLSPYIAENYNDSIDLFIKPYALDENKEEVKRQFSLDTMLQRLKQKPAGYDFVFPYRSEDGLRYKQINVLWGDENHRTVCLVRADVTDMLAAERQSKKDLEDALALAEEANQAKSDFLSAMSHDIRTPMNAIMGMTELAIAHLDDQKRVEDCLHKISISSRHLLSLINDILDMSKIEQSKITLNPIKVSLSNLMDQLSAMIEPQARTAGLQFHVQKKKICHDCFYGDSLRISQILINLLSNAVKFTPAGGRVEFLVEETAPVKNAGGVRYRFTVCDTGIGMPEEFLGHLFEPFTRSRTAARIEGTGLGLSITKGLINLMDGEISVESQVNKGSTFQVELECDVAQDSKEARLEHAGEKTHLEEGNLFAGCCFLIAEDNEINAEILCELLWMYGAKTVVKTDGAQAVQAFRDEAPGTYDAILMDIQMPEMNGYEATRTVRKMDRPDAKEIPIIAMTANAFSEDVQASIDAGMNAHVAKPIDVNILQATLSKALGIGGALGK